MAQAAEQTGVREMCPWHQAARATAIVAAVFSAIFTVLLVVNLFGSAIIGPQRENKLAAMKVQVQKEPTNQELLSAIRVLDLKIRRDRTWRLDFAQKAAFMLLGSLIVLAVSGKLAGNLAQELPRPRLVTERGERQMREARQARWTVAGGLAVLAGGMVLLGLTRWVNFGRAEDAGPAFASMEERKEQWPRFRGPAGAGISTHANVPTSWNGKTGDGILWKTKIPLPGHNSPIVWKDRVFLAGADPNARQVYCFDAASGRLLWQGDVSQTAPHEGKFEMSEDTGYAPSTLATDGRRVYAIFPSGDVAGFDFNGRRLWHKALGIPDSAYGYASSLDTYEKLVLIQYDQSDAREGKSRLYALDGTTGQITWEAKRPVSASWTSPVVVDVAGQAQLLAAANPYVISYNPANGTELWRAECNGSDMCPSPICAGGLAFVIEPYSQLAAIRANGQGDVTKTHIAWKMDEGAPDICSPVSNGTYVYMLGSEGPLTCCNVADGKKVFEQEFKEQFRASPSIVGDKLYLLSLKGVMHIVQIGSEYKELGTCDLGEECLASPAFADGRVYIRGVQNLYCLGKAP